MYLHITLPYGSLTFASCHLNYVGQTGQSLKHCYFKCVQYIRYSNPQSAYTNHILQHAYVFGPIQNTLTLIHRASKGCLMDIVEQFFIQKYDREHKLILEQIPGENNPLFTLRRTIMSPSQPALVFDSAVMLQSCNIVHGAQ